MKTFIITIGFFLSICMGLAQETNHTTPKEGDYLQHPELKKFAGKWRDVSNNDTVDIILIKVKHLTPIKVYIDMLYLWHIYIKNREVISSTMQYVTENVTRETNSLGLVIEPDNPYKISLLSTDPITGKRAYIVLTYIDSPLHLDWEIKPYGVPNDFVIPEGYYSLPLKLTFYKLE